MKRIEKMCLWLIIAMSIQTVAVAEPLAKALPFEYEDLQVVMTKLDADQDGYISLKESVKNTALLQNFSTIDKNGDGMLSQDELLDSENVNVAALFKLR